MLPADGTRGTRAHARDFAAEVARRLREQDEQDHRAQQKARPPDYTQGLTAIQREAFDASAQGDLALPWARRTGKTYLLPRVLLRDAEEPGTWSVYLTKTRLNAKQLLWRWLKKAARDLGIPYTTNESDLVLERPGGGNILLGGANDLSAIERWRQYGWKRVVLDEMGVLDEDPNLLETLIDDVIEPATTDHGGLAVFAGTPGYLLGKRWHHLSGPNSPIRVINADARSNTAVPGLWARILALKAKHGWSDDHPTWVREYLGQWVLDESSLVYPFDPERNSCSGLPTHTVTGVRLEQSGWRYCLGVDVGYVDATAFVLGCCHELDPRAFIVQSESHTGWLPDRTAEHIRSEYLARYPWLRVVVDAGGMGKVHAETLRHRYPEIPAVAAEKTEKPDAIRDLRGRVLSGQVQVLDGAQNDALRACWGRLGWDKARLHHHPDQDDHEADAALYMDRALRHWLMTAPDLPQPLTPAQEAARLREAYKRRHKPRPNAWGTSFK